MTYIRNLLLVALVGLSISSYSAEPSAGIMLGAPALPNGSFASHSSNKGWGGWHIGDTNIPAYLLAPGTAVFNTNNGLLYVYTTNATWTEFTASSSPYIIKCGASTTTPNKLYMLLTNTTTWVLATATNASTCSGLLGVSVGTNSTSNGMILRGLITTNNLTIGSTIYISTQGGEFTSVQPTTSGYIIRPIGHAISTSSFEFSPSDVYLGIE